MAVADEWKDRVCEAIHRMENDGHEGFSIVTRCETIKVHGWLLSLHSPVFAKMCRGPFLEAQNKTIELKEDHPGSVESMVEFLYRGNCYLDADSYFGLTVPTYILAEKYDMQHLKAYVLNHFELELGFLNSDEVYEYGDYVSEVACAVETIYQAETATEELRMRLADDVVKHDLFATDMSKFEELFKNTTFAMDIAKAIKRQLTEKDKEKKKDHRPARKQKR